jgi:hypothetical protein
MRFWTRELAGWFLIALGLYVFYRSYVLFTDEARHPVIEGGSLTLVGIVIFRGGIHLVKVAMAARACLRAQEELERAPAKTATATLAPSPGRSARSRTSRQ